MIYKPILKKIKYNAFLTAAKTFEEVTDFDDLSMCCPTAEKEQPGNIMHRRGPKEPFCCFFILSLTNLFVFCAVELAQMHHKNELRSFTAIILFMRVARDQGQNECVTREHGE